MRITIGRKHTNTHETGEKRKHIIDINISIILILINLNYNYTKRNYFYRRDIIKMQLTYITCY